jgi:hypothetical protein
VRVISCGALRLGADGDVVTMVLLGKYIPGALEVAAVDPRLTKIVLSTGCGSSGE